MLSQDPLHTFPGNFPIRPRRGRLPTGKQVLWSLAITVHAALWYYWVFINLVLIPIKQLEMSVR